MIQKLHAQAVKLSARYRDSETRLIGVLMELDELKGHRKLGFRSLHEYVTSSLKLSDHVAFTLITLARKSREIPELKRKIENQSLQMTHARMIAPILTVENQAEWLNKAEVLSKRLLEREIKKAFPEKAVREMSRYITAERLELKLGVSEELLEKLKRVQDLVSQSTGQAATLEEALDRMADLFIDKNDPVKKAERAKELVPGRVLGGAALKHALQRRDQGQCAHKDIQGRRCKERRWLDAHHIQPRSRGGPDTLENLVILCKSHHQMLHEPGIRKASQ